MISAGDQVNKTGEAKEEEYASYLSADALKGLAVATTIGNHDSLNEDYMYHFNNPNNTENGKTQAGGDYYYSYGEGLFVVLNTNNYNVAEHQKTIEEAVKAYPDAKWRIVTIHQDIYGSGLDHSDTDGMILRTQLTPVFDANDIDVVLQGHDHTYSRSKMLYGDGQTHGKYEFSLNADGTDYDWDHATNVDTQEQIALAPEEGDTDAQAALDAFHEDNNCYTIEDVDGDTVTDPQGILYMTANSASGSKYYELLSTQQDYVAARSQNWLPSYSVITLTADTFAIDTYQITDDGKAEAIDDTFTIKKTGADAADASADTTDGASVYTQDREGVIYIFALIYLLVLCLIGGKQGIKGCLGLVFTFFCVIFVYLPLVYLKYSPFWTAVFVCFITTLVTMYLIGGATRKTCAATLGTLVGVILAGVSAWCFSKASGISGYNVSDIETLMTLWNTNRIQVGGLLFSGLLISCLGAVMDVAMSISSAIDEIYRQRNWRTR